MKTLRVQSLHSRTSSRIVELEKAYIKDTDWEVHENANTNTSYSNFLGFVLDKLLKRPSILLEYLPHNAVSLHFDGGIHIHKLPHSLWIAYCAGWSYGKILKIGLKTPTIISKPAKHLDTAVSHLINYFFLAAQEWTGAQAVSAFDLYVAPFVNHDKLDYRSVKQALQRMLFELNYPSRMGYQSPFTNITLVLDTSKEFLEREAIVNGKVTGTLGDYVDEAITVTSALLDLYLEGDAQGRPFTFPIPTIMLTNSFDWNGRKWGDLVDKLFQTLAMKGTAYLLNGYATNVESLYSMCCRLTIDLSKVINNNAKLLIEPLLDTQEEFEEFLRRNRSAFGIWALPDATGSIGVVTINLPRLAILSKGEWDKFEELLYKRLEIARKVLKTFRKRYEQNLKAGLMPITKVYLGHLNSHFNTIGLVGLPEAAANLMNYPDLWIELSTKRINEAVSVMKEIVSTVRKVSEEYEEIDNCLYNVEEVPAESAAYRLATLDYRLFKEKIERREAFIPSENGTPYYSNSIIPYYADIPLPMRAKWEGEVQQEFTGGVMMHIFLYQSIDPKTLKKLVYRIATQTKVIYFSLTPAITVCPKCHHSTIGIYTKCPQCNSKQIEIWSRIVGYYRPINNWNIGKKAEFFQRIHYGTNKTITPKTIKNT